MSQLEVDKVIPQSGTTLTLGDSADTITIPSGATLDATNATVTYPAGSITDAAISSTAAIQQSKISGSPGFRNIVINGDMQIAQRSTSVASITTSGYYTVDRWDMALTGLGTWTQSQSTDVPTGQGFASSLKLDCTTANASPSASDNILIIGKFEGQNLQYLKKGTASAQSLTLSFWVKSTKTGTFIAEIRDFDNTRAISKSYTVNVTNTWEFKTITFPGDTTGTLNNDNGSSLQLQFWLGAGTNFTSGTLATTWSSRVFANVAVGQVNIADDTSNDWYITGVQLEAGTTASDFEFLPVDVNLARCRRYFRTVGKSGGSTPMSVQGAQYLDANNMYLNYLSDFTNMRSLPTATLNGSANTDYAVYDSQFNLQTGFTFSLGVWAGFSGFQIQCVKTGHGLTNVPSLYFGSVTSSGFVTLSSEL
jgi:hypothetical protein